MLRREVAGGSSQLLGRDKVARGQYPSTTVLFSATRSRLFHLTPSCICSAVPWIKKTQAHIPQDLLQLPVTSMTPKRVRTFPITKQAVLHWTLARCLPSWLSWDTLFLHVVSDATAWALRLFHLSFWPSSLSWHSKSFPEFRMSLRDSQNAGRHTF